MMKVEHYQELMEMVEQYGDARATNTTDATIIYNKLNDTMLAFCMECCYQQELANRLKSVLELMKEKENNNNNV